MSGEGVDSIRRRQLGQLARAKGPVERRLMRMRQNRRGLFNREAEEKGRWETSGGEAKEREGRRDAADIFKNGDESLALIQW